MDSVRTQLCNLPELYTFDPRQSTIVTTDASGEGLGATLSQIQNAQEVPIAYDSHTLTAAEKNYAINEREALGSFMGPRTLGILPAWPAHSRCVATISLWELSSNIPVNANATSLFAGRSVFHALILILSTLQVLAIALLTACHVCQRLLQQLTVASSLRPSVLLE